MSAEGAQAWLRKADNDILSADNNLASTQVPYDAVCYHSQQAAEKSLKALLVYLGVQPLRTHDLLAILQELRRYLTSPVPDNVERQCVVLNPYAVEVRYPDDESNPSLEDAREARESAGTVYRWVRQFIPKKEPDSASGPPKSN